MSTEPFESETPSVLREWDALNVLDTLTTRSEDALVLLNLVATNPDLCDHGTAAVASALLAIEQQLADALGDMREAQEALWHHYRERRANAAPAASNPWPFSQTTAAVKPVSFDKKKAAKKPAKVAAKKTKK